MLNRLFIVIGVLAILAIGAAFVVPRFIPWGDYRERMEVAASAALGAPVEIAGDIEFALLPQPELKFGDVIVGPRENPVLRIARVEAQFSLIDFIRDQYTVTRLILREPDIGLSIGADGRFELGIALTETLTGSNVSIAQARIDGGRVRLADARTQAVLLFDGIAGDLRINAVRGPFAFQGSGVSAGHAYDVRFTTSAIGEDGRTQLSLFTRPADESWSLSAEGTAVLGAEPRFTGDLTYRLRPPAGGDRNDARGELVLAGKLEASPVRILLSSYSLTPDANRASTRLTGAAEITLTGAAPRFNAVISGGVLALPPRDATSEEVVAPYELVRLIGELPPPPVPPLAGSINVDIAELNLRAVALRNVRFDAASDGVGWQVKEFTGMLPGNTALRLSGTLGEGDGRPTFEGRLSLGTGRLDLLAQLWRKPAASNPLFDVAASFDGRITLAADVLTVGSGALVIDGVSHETSGQIAAGASRRIDWTVRFGALDGRQSEIVGALLPLPQTDPAFGVTFPRGRLDISAPSARIMGLDGRGLAFNGGWEGGVLDIERIAAEDLGGATFAFGVTAFGTFARPELSGEGTLRLASAAAPALDRLFDGLRTPAPIVEAVRRATPADLAIVLEPPGRDGSQTLTAKGTLGVATLDARAMLGAGLPRAIGNTIGLTLELASGDPAGLSAQIGLGAVDLFPAGTPMRVALALQGDPANSLETSVLAEGGGDSVRFSGNVVVFDPRQWSGRGTVSAELSDSSGLAGALGAGGLSLPAFKGQAELSFTGTDSLRLEGIEAQSGWQALTGSLALTTQAGRRAVTGTLSVSELPVVGLMSLLVGPAGMMVSPDRLWPDGPIGVGPDGPTTTGRVRINSPALTAGNLRLAGGVAFDLDWDAQTLRLGNFTAELGGGRLALDAAICCPGPLPVRTLKARVVIDAADLKSILPPDAAASLGGTIDLNAQVEGTGESLDALVASLAGEGSFAIRELVVAGLDPGAFAAAGEVDNIVELAPDALGKIITSSLEAGSFGVPGLSGSFTIAGGVLRSPNVAVETQAVRFQGGGSLRLTDLALDGAFTLAPKGTVGASGLISEATSQVVAKLGGTLLSPVRTFDVAAMVDAVQVKAYEIELAELERLRAEDEARQRAAQEERDRLAAERSTAYRQAAMTAIEAAPPLDEALARIAAGEAARRAAQAELDALSKPAVAPEPAAQPAREVQSPSFTTLGPLNLTPAEPASQF